MLKQILFVLVIAVILVTSCGQQEKSEASPEDLRAIVQKQNTMLEEYFKEGNADKVATLYTDSAKLSPNGGNFVFGRDSIRKFWADDFKTSKALEMNTNVLTTDGDEDVIYETGKTKVKFIYNDSTYTSSIKYINVWVKQQDGSYKLDVDFWNKDKPEN